MGPVPLAPKSIEQLEYERLHDLLTPLVDAALDGVSPLVPLPASALVVIAVLFRQAARLAITIGMGKLPFEQRAAAIIARAYAPRVEVPRVIL